MSHFTVLVCLTEAEYRSDMRGNLDKRLAPFDENFSTPPYIVRCSCADWAHRRLVQEAVQEKLNYNYGDLRDSFSPIRAVVVTEYFNSIGQPEPEHIGFMEEPEDLEELIQVAWDKHRQEIEDTEAAFSASIPIPAPSADCEDCHGTGLHESTYNPMSQWDWYRIGGRWTGALVEAISDLSPMPNKDTALACELAGKYQPFAIVDSNGIWHQRGSMGWFGMSTDEMTKDEWKAASEAILKAQPQGAIAILVDCHI